MIEVTDEMQAAFRDAWMRSMQTDPSTDDPETVADRAGLAAVLAIVERDLRTQIAYRIRAELVCCDVFEKTHDTPAWARASKGPHSICYWGEVAARLAEEATPPQ